jgi:hypothetical protein
MSPAAIQCWRRGNARDLLGTRELAVLLRAELPESKPLDEAIPGLYEAGSNPPGERTENSKSTSGGMADAPDLGSGAARRGGSSPPSCTTLE